MLTFRQIEYIRHHSIETIWHLSSYDNHNNVIVLSVVPSLLCTHTHTHTHAHTYIRTHIQWIPLPIFVLYRILLFLYTVIWLILHIEARADLYGPHWLIFITDLSYALLVISTGAVAILCSVYAMTQCKNSQKLLKFLPKRDFPPRRIYKQDNIPWYVKIVWMLYIVSKTTAVLIFVGYWTIVYRPCDNEGSGMEVDDSLQSNTSSGNASEPDQGGLGRQVLGEFTCSFLDVYTVQLHGVNTVIVLLDMCLSRVPYQFLHFPYPSIFTLTYIIFSLVYWGAGGTNANGMPYIYSSLDYETKSSAFILGVLLIFAPILIFFILFLFAWLRDVVYMHISCCFRDVKRQPYQDSDTLTNLEMNGNSAAAAGVTDEITKV